MKRGAYERRKAALQSELLKVQRWVKESGSRVVVLFEGARCGRQGRHHQAVHGAPEPPAAPRVVALEKPTERERGQW